MNPKEYAKELYYKFTTYSPVHSDNKQCALIAINEMLDFRNKLYFNKGSLANQYLLEVKQEIEKM